MKKSIPIIWEQESEAFIPGNGREREFLVSPDIELFKVNIIMMPIARYTVPESQLKRMVENPPSPSPCRSGGCSRHQGRGGESRKEKSRTGDAGKRGDDDYEIKLIKMGNMRVLIKMRNMLALVR